jgi:UDP-2,4-diacetamido-2,4,6-trideoxy-beta-L-altropyranose hydrolase
LRIAFRVDAGLLIGTGHVMRCLTLADEVRERGSEVVFVCREHDRNLCDVIRGKGFPVVRLPVLTTHEGNDEHWPRGDIDPATGETTPIHAGWLGADWRTDADETVAALSGSEAVDWLVVDHYALDARWESRVRSLARRIMVIDDLADRPHACDLLLDQNLFTDLQGRYKRRIPQSCRTLLGPKYALLRPEFTRQREWQRDRTRGVHRILIAFGGVDTTNETLKAIQAVDALGRTDIEVDVVIGAGNPHREDLTRQLAERPSFQLHVQTDQMAELMAKADVAIGAGGVATWERCAVGLPAIAWAIADNQQPVIEAVAETGAVLMPDQTGGATRGCIEQHLFSLLNSRYLRAVMSRAGLSICDGRGVQRVAQVMMAPEITLRSAMATDCEAVYEWRNHPSVRRVSLSQEPIGSESHRAWFNRTLSDSSRALLIAESAGVAVGVLRFDLLESEAEVSVFLAPRESGRGLGQAILEAGEHWLRKHHPEVGHLRATVLDANRPSKALFEKAGFSAHHLVYTKVLHV